MSKKWLIFSLLSAACLAAAAQAPTLDDRLQHRSETLRSRWNALYPTQSVLQNAGNMGVASLGVGWVYGRRDQWETQLFVGLVPKHQADHAHPTITLKQNYIPFHLTLGQRWEYGPLRCGVYLNAIIGTEFWRTQPARYPDRYYEFMSTKFRFNLFVGQQVSYRPPIAAISRITAFCEVSTCDLYLRSWASSSYLHLTDILGLSVGLSAQLGRW